jgi:predicted naringenin-chalcone synthase
MTVYLSGIGKALPVHVLSQPDALRMAQRLLADRFGDLEWLEAIYRRSGIEARRSVLVWNADAQPADGLFHSAAGHEPGWCGPGTGARMKVFEACAPGLAVQAARQSLAAAGVGADEIAHVVTVCCTGFASPGVDAALVKELGLRASVGRTHVGFMGCHGALNGLRVAAAHAAAGPVLVVCVELCTLHFQYSSDAERLVANALFADGAAAAVVSNRASPGGVRLGQSFSMLIPETAALMSWRIGDAGFEMGLSSRVPGVIRDGIEPVVHGWLDGVGVERESITQWCVHPGGPKVLDAVRDGLDLDDAALTASRAVLRDYGNMSSPTVLFILDQILQSQLPRSGQTSCIPMLAFGPGLTIEGLMLHTGE